MAQSHPAADNKLDEACLSQFGPVPGSLAD